MSSTPAGPFEKFGKYLLLEKIAAGGMAEVYLAKSAVANGLNKFVALKRILPQYSGQEEFVDMFKEEAKVAINLNHSNVVTIYDFGVESKQFFLVMEFVEGRNLRQIINELKKSNRSFSIEQAVFMIKEVAAGLDHAHRCVDANSGRPLNITHRDMSPQNVMISFEGEVKVIDFGIAKAETEKEETKAGTLKGKFSYMSPEQAEGQPIDPRTDIFALGIVMWELLANDRLFTGSNESAILRKVRECQVPPIRKVNPLVPQELERIVMKALAKDRNVRYQTAANLHRDLNRFLNVQYPDFSSHDFSSFLKDSFKVSYQEARDKLVHYSKAEATVVPQDTMTAPPPPPQEPPAQAQKPAQSAGPEAPKVASANPSEPPRGLTLDPNKPKINLDGLLDAQVVRNKNAGPGQNTRIGAPAPGSRSGASGQTRITQITQVSVSKSRPKPPGSDFAETGLKFLILALVVGGGYWGYKNGLREMIEKNFSGHAEVAGHPVNSGKIDMAAKALVKVSVSSSPQGAALFIDGKDLGQVTPAIISLTANKEAVISLRKAGYLPYEVSKKFGETSSFAATMQPAPQAAFVDISIANGGPSTKIYVNGKELSEKPPITKYPVVAGQEAIIKAYNPITRQTDELKVNLRVGESKSIELILGRIPETTKK